eukprot:CAMPEP_0172324048 /NCGR_PEP_ID=MMETSP1058-20130122/50235_1 /TAXON_ID=83371 /ORGANISM="Detonula confervacea, Strain CCMP 353" /LENGTH=160 /DNA_ID=CAMNT_0013040209 /DNA_START=32 /DNA_END=511 /DNA_ORIENTATION=-
MNMNMEDVSLNEYDEQPLRLDLLEKQTVDKENAIERKERMRMEEFTRLTLGSAEKRGQRQRQQQQQQLQLQRRQEEREKLQQQKKLQLQRRRQEEERDEERRESGSTGTSGSNGSDDIIADDIIAGSSSSSHNIHPASYKTNEARRLEDLDQYFNKRRSA